jgi:arylamine N-acetyltransferase
MYPILSSTLIDRYLTLLGVLKREPSFDALCEIVRAHALQVPFENISKIFYMKHQNLHCLPSLELYLEGIQKFHFGGTCYANNYYLYQLLANLGYQITLCGADMLDPDVHMVSMVTVENREYLIDVGYAAPFLNPLPRDLTEDYCITLGRDRYVLKPKDIRGNSYMELHRDGSLKHGYMAKIKPRQIQEFEPIILDSFREDSTFMNALLLARFFPKRSILIHNMTLIYSQGTTSNIRIMANQRELVHLIHKKFGIPRELVQEVLDEMELRDDAWSWAPSAHNKSSRLTNH